MIAINNSVNYLEQQANLQNVNLVKPFIRIIEQPARAALRFRYKCEGRSAGSLPGVNSTNEKKTYPTIEIVNYRGRCSVVVSCVTAQPPYLPHPHNLVGKDNCKKGVCNVLISNSSQMKYQFESLGIQCCRRRDIRDSLIERESLQIDPFKTGFDHIKDFSFIDLNSVRLCFEAYIEDSQGKFKLRLEPVLSTIIYDKKTMADLYINEISHLHASVFGGQNAILLCNCVLKDNIQIRFYELDPNGNLIWESYANLLTIHKQSAISFKIPKYRLQNINQPVECFVQLRRKTDGQTSQSKKFYYLPEIAYQLIDQVLKDLSNSLENVQNDSTLNCMNSLVNPLNSNLVTTTNQMSKNLVNNLTFQNLQQQQTQSRQSSNQLTSSIVSVPLNACKRRRSDGDHQCLMAKRNAISLNLNGKNNKLILNNFDTLQQQLTNPTSLSNTISVNNYSNSVPYSNSSLPINISSSNEFASFQTVNQDKQNETNYFDFRNPLYQAQQIRDELNHRTTNNRTLEQICKSNEPNLDLNFNNFVVDVNNNGFVLNNLTKN